MWESECFFRTSSDVYEAFAVGLLSELGGDKEYAKCLFETLLKENPIDKDAIDTLELFYQRNPEMRG